MRAFGADASWTVMLNVGGTSVRIFIDGSPRSRYAHALTVSGYANSTVPAGFVSGLPIGLSFIGTAFSEKTLIDLAYAFEQASKIRRPPPLD